MFQFVKTIERRDAVPFGKRWVVKHLVDKIIDPCVKTHGDLSNVDHFGSSPSDDMDAEDLQSVFMEQDLEHARIVADDLVSRDLVVIRPPNLVMKPELIQLLFSIPTRRYFWYGINSDWVKRGEGVRLCLECVACSEPPLLHACRSKSRASDHISYGVDVRLICLKERIYRDVACGAEF